jgi:hypothetical protein
MKLYQKLKDQDLVENFKEFNELIWMRAIKVNGTPIDDPNFDLSDSDNDIQIGILSLR